MTFYNTRIVRAFLLFFRAPMMCPLLCSLLCSLMWREDRQYIIPTILTTLFIWLTMSQIGFCDPNPKPNGFMMTRSDFENGKSIGEHAVYNCEFFIYKLILAGKFFSPSVKSDMISESMKNEILGFVDGFNKGSYFRITFDQVLRYHKLADSKCACTCRVVKKGLLERNMDWFPFGSAGTDTIILNYIDWKSLTVPGFFGVVTGFRDEYVLAMNVSPGKLTEGAELACSMNRSIIQKYSSPQEVLDFVKTNPQTYSEYHLTIVSPNSQFCYSFGSSTLREELPLYTVNFREPAREEYSFSSPERLEYLKMNEDKKRLLDEPMFNTVLTVHSLVINTHARKATCFIDNGFAGDIKHFPFIYDYSKKNSMVPLFEDAQKELDKIVLFYEKNNLKKDSAYFEFIGKYGTP
jgi:hypothetical protein